MRPVLPQIARDDRNAIFPILPPRSRRRRLCRAAAGALFLGALLAGIKAGAEEGLALIPYPRQVLQSEDRLVLKHAVTIRAANAEDRFAAGLLASDLRRTPGILAQVRSGAGPAAIVLARVGTADGDRFLRRSGFTFPVAADEEGYVVTVDAYRAAVVARSSAGIFYGAQTLRQLLHPDAKTVAIPAVKILDWPALRRRGSQASMSQGAAPTLQDLKRAVTLLSGFKQNLFMLYFENTFDYSSLPLNAMPGGGMTPAEAREFVSFARDYHVIVIPEQESMGHLHQVLREEKYQDLTETPYGNVLTPTSPGALKFVSRMFAELAQTFPGPFLHIGADETFELGQGRTRQLVEREGKGQVYVDFIKQVDAALRIYGRRILFWGDIAERYPQLLNQLPHDMIAMPWNYKNLKLSDFEGMIAPFQKAGMETWVAPGVDNWNNIFPNYMVAMPNIRVFTEAGRRMGSTGMMNTTWNDDGESLFDATWYGLAYGSAAAWQDTLDDAQFRSAYDWVFYGASGHHFERQIEDLTEIYAVLYGAIPTDGIDRFVWADPFTPEGEKLYLSMAPVARRMRLLAERVIEDVRSSRTGAARNRDLLDPVEFAARRFDYLGEKAIYTKYIADLYASAQAEVTSNPGRVVEVLDRIAASDGLLLDLRNQNGYLLDSYRSLWLAGNRPYFLGNMLLHYERENDRIAAQIDRFRSIRRNFAATHCLPPLLETGAEACRQGAAGP